MSSAIEELEKLASEMERPTQPMIADPYGYYARLIRKLLPRLRTEERDGKRGAFVAGAVYGVTEFPGTLESAKAEAEKRNP